MKNIFKISWLIIFSIVSIHGYTQPKTGTVFPAWSEGYLDIHHINTGKGESAFFILPDGTTMLVDAGATQRSKPRVTDPKPDGSRTPGEWIVRYIDFMEKTLTEKKLDYVLLTHFHDDHIGELFSGAKQSEKGDYKLTGITEVGEYFSIGKMIDRGWPDYNWPVPLKSSYIQNYVRFAKWLDDKGSGKVEQFKVGENNQFRLLYRPEKYPGFEIRNIAANGHVWTGVGKNERNYFPELKDLNPREYPGENQNSIAFRLSYGTFDYYNGGDLTTGAPGSWQDIETPVGLVTGPVDVCLANHHAYYDAMGVPFLQAVRPRIFIIQSWAPSHPSPSVLARMMSTWTYPGERDVYSTNVMESTHKVIGSRIDNMKSQQGHIVIRVSPGGENYTIFILDDSTESFKIKSVHGPYVSK